MSSVMVVNKAVAWQQLPFLHPFKSGWCPMHPPIVTLLPLSKKGQTNRRNVSLLTQPLIRGIYQENPPSTYWVVWLFLTIHNLGSSLSLSAPLHIVTFFPSQQHSQFHILPTLKSEEPQMHLY